MINKQKTKVLFAEAGSDFTDVLLSFLTLPLGKIVRVLEKHYGDEAPAVGSLTTLYKGLSNLDSDHFWTEGGKQMLLDPRNSLSEECRNLKLDITDNQPIKYFSCEDWNCRRPRKSNIGIYYGTARCSCGKTLKREVCMKNTGPEAANANDGAFTLKKVAFLISDDLQILPNVTASLIQIVTELGITDTDWGELKNVTFGINEIMDLLKCSFHSPTPLTDVVLKKEHRLDPGILLRKIEDKATSNFKTMTVKVILQKSTNRLLFAESDEEFVDFLFSSLTIPLGGLEFLSGGNACLKSIDNLYWSVANVIDGKFFNSADTKNRLLQPKLPPGYHSENQFLPLVEERGRTLYYYKGTSPGEEYVSPPYQLGCYSFYESSLKSPKGGEYYVKAPGMFMVTDDLTVRPQSMASSVSILNGLKIHLSDVTELELHIGLEEALSILKAALTSTSALSIGLGPMLMNQPKQELS